MRKINLLILITFFISISTSISYAKKKIDYKNKKYKNLINTIDDDDDDEFGSFIIDYIRAGIRFNLGLSVASIFSNKEFEKPIINKDFTYLQKLKPVSKVPYNFEIFVGGKPFSWLAFDFGLLHNFTETGLLLDCKGRITKIRKSPFRMNSLPHFYDFRFKQLEYLAKMIFFYGDLYGAIGLKVINMIYCKITKRINYNKIEDKNIIKILKANLGDGRKITYDVLHPDVRRWYPSLLLYLGYEFSFGLNIESSIEIPFEFFKYKKYMNIFKTINNRDKFHDFFACHNEFLIAGVITASRPLIYISLGYDFIKLF